MNDKLGVREVCIFAVGMAAGGMVREMYQRFEQKGAENRIFNATSCPYWEPQSLTPDGYESNAPQGYTGPYYTITENPAGQAWNHWVVTKPDGTHQNRKATLKYAKALVVGLNNSATGKHYWKDMQNSATSQTSCPNCCVVSTPPPPPPPPSSTSGNGSSGSGSSTSSSATPCPACDSCCGQCPECMDCPPATKCDSCCPPCQNNAGQSTFLGRFFGN